MNDYIIRFIDLPITVKAVTVQDGNGFNNIYVNARISFWEQQVAIAHELKHIQRDDFYSLEPLEVVETM